MPMSSLGAIGANSVLIENPTKIENYGIIIASAWRKSAIQIEKSPFLKLLQNNHWKVSSKTGARFVRCVISDENLGVPKNFIMVHFLIVRISRLVIHLKTIFFYLIPIKYKKKTRKYEIFYRCHRHDCRRFSTELQRKMWPRIEQMQIWLWFKRFMLGEMQSKLLQMPWQMLISVQVKKSFCTEIK